MKNLKIQIVFMAFFGVFFFTTGCQQEFLLEPDTNEAVVEIEESILTKAKATTHRGVRHYAGIGVKSSGKKAFDRPGNGWLRTEYNKLLSIAVRQSPSAFNQHYPVVSTKVEWSKAYINQNIKPTRKQAQDPNWPNYIWNRRTDGITHALNDPLIANGRGKVKLAITMALTSTSGQYLPPAWMRRGGKDNALTWEEPKNQNGAVGNWHVRFDNPDAVNHTSDFMTAFLKKFGNNTGIHSITLGEYYPKLKEKRPRGFNEGKFWRGARDLWRKVIDAAPRRNGNRVNILQTNPKLKSGVTVGDLERIGIGMSVADTRIDLPISKAPETQTLRRLYNGKKVHVMLNGDSRYSRQGRRFTWDGTRNPFGHRKGYSGVATPQELFWYHGSKGPVPIYSLILAPTNEGPQTNANILKAIKEFGRGGSKANRWGPSPAQFSW